MTKKQRQKWALVAVAFYVVMLLVTMAWAVRQSPVQQEWPPQLQVSPTK